MTVTELADNYGISHNHLVKVVHNLATLGYIQTYKGRGGGMRLARPAESINLGEVVRHTEVSLEIFNCWKPLCPLTPSCILRSALAEASGAFISVLDRYTIADLVKNKHQLLELLG
ncbi:MAG: Rrf2 family transcriptional regulator [Rhodospirillales bacterium]|nr:Rrf2 family transcriptional regulator [Rhodospirillales bacterium]HJO72284.1 Rrf2 family transcriptional regulator [Rhodospirillales bacterium]